VSSLPASYTARWFNPRSGNRFPAAGGPTFAPPDGNDWALHIGPPIRVYADLGNPDTGKGLTNAQYSDGDTTPATIGGRTGRKNVDANSDYYFYFRVVDSFAYQASKQDLYITIDYYDTGTGSLALQYDSNTGSGTSAKYKNGGSVSLAGSNTWKRYTFHVTDAYFGNRQNASADFRIVGPSGQTFYLDLVEVTDGHPVAVATANPATGPLPLTVHFDGSQSYDRGGSIASYQWDFNDDGIIDATGASIDHQYPGSGGYMAVLIVSDGSGLSDTASVPIFVDGAPYLGTPLQIPGMIEAEYYDLGGEGIAYHDSSSGNDGGALRNEDVDIEPTSDDGGGYDVGWINDGEWLRYTVNVAAAGNYDIRMRVAEFFPGGVVHLEMNGVDLIGPQSVPPTGGLQNWTTIIVPNVRLAAGQQTLRVVANAGGWSLNYITFYTSPLIRADLDGDGDVDQEDFARVQRCLAGPEVPYPAGCDGADVDLDGDVDDGDVAEFLNCMTGPNQPPHCP